MSTPATKYQLDGTSSAYKSESDSKLQRETEEDESIRPKTQ